MKLIAVLLLSLGLTVPCSEAQKSAQSPPQPEEEYIVPDRAETPRDVLLIMALARSLEEIEVLLPEFARREAKKLYKDDRETLLDQLALGMLGRRHGYTVRPGDREGVIAYGVSGADRIDLRLFHEVIGGDTAIVLFGLCDGVKDKCEDERIQAWLRNEDNSWRLVHLVEAKTELSLDEREYFDAVREKSINQRERHAAQRLEELNAQLHAYSQRFPERGWPLELQPLMETPGPASSFKTSESELRCRRSRCVGGGYQYVYEPFGGGYRMWARPSRYRLTGELSFAVTDSSELHCTADERIPSERDPVVKKGAIDSCREPVPERPPEPEQPQPE